MMTEVVPWVKWRFDRWKNDECLRMCGLAARGLWADLLAIMHGGKPYGHLSINGRAPTAKQIASLVGMTTEKEVASLIRELGDAGVFSRSDDGLIYCRRMVRDNEARIRGKATGSTGGNPALIGGRTKKDNEDGYPPNDGEPITSEVNPPRKPREERGETRDEKRDTREEKAARSGDRPCRLPDGWEPDLEARRFAREAGFDPDALADKFRDYWRAKAGKDGVKADWPATWRNWCRNEKPAASNGGGSHDNKSGRRAAFAILPFGQVG